MIQFKILNKSMNLVCCFKYNVINDDEDGQLSLLYLNNEHWIKFQVKGSDPE